MDGYNSLIDSISRPSPYPDDSESALRSTYRWIEAFIGQKHYAPTIFEIASGLSIKYDAARNRLLKMEQRRWIGRDGRIRSIVLRGIPDADPTPAMLDYNALAEMSDRLAVAIAGHERGPELHEFFEEAYRSERRRLEMEAQLVEAERLGEQDAIHRL